MANLIRVSVENPEELLNAGLYGAGAIIRLQSGAAEAGPFANEATAALVAGTYLYTLFDADGTSAAWYRSRYENAGGTSVSDWAAAFQVGDEQGGLLCSIYDFKQRLEIAASDTSQDENLLEWIRQVSAWITSQIGRSLVPDPASGTKTYRFHTRPGLVLRLPKGIRSITSLGVATEDQPASGGTYTAASSTAYYIDPPEAERDYGWPGTSVVFRRNATGAATRFYDASYGAEVVGAFGWGAVPGDIAAIALTLSVSAARERSAGGGDSITIGLGGERTFERALSYKDRLTIDWYRVRTVG